MYRWFRAIASATTCALLVSACSRDPQQAKREYLESADRLHSEKKYGEAIIQYRNALTIDPRIGPARFKLGQAYAETGDLPNALREYVRAADIMPGDVEAQLAAGLGLLAIGRYPEAQSRAQAALAKEPKNVSALLLLGNSMAGMKDLDGAITQVEDAITTDPQRVLSYANLGQLELARGNRDAAESAFKRAVEIEPRSVSAHLSMANFFWASNSGTEAEKEFKVALELDPKSILANQGLAVFYTLSGRLDESEPYLKAYAELSEGSGPKLVLADYYVMKGRVGEATTLLKMLLDTKDGYVPARRRLASLDFVAGRHKEAYAGIDEILAKQPKNDEALLQRARFLMVERKPDEALTQVAVVVKENPKSAPGLFLQGVAQKAIGDADSATKSFQDVLKLRPNATPAVLELADLHLVAGNYDSALEFANQAIKAAPRNGQPYIVRAWALLRKGDIRQMEADVVGLVRDNPRSADVQALAAEYYFAKGDAARSRASYERAIALDPGSLVALTGLVTSDLRANRIDAALERVNARLSQTPDNEPLLFLAGKTFLAAKDFTKAEKAFRHVLDVNPDSVQAYRTLATFYLQQNRLEDAKRDFEEVARRNPKGAGGALTMVGTILAAQGKDGEAREQYRKALELDSTAAIAANNLAWDYAETGGNLDEALKLAQSAKSRLPDNAGVNDTMGWIYYKKGLAGLAVASLQDAARQAPNDPSIRYRLGLAYLKNGDQRMARAAFEQALKISSQFKEAADARSQLEALKS